MITASIRFLTNNLIAELTCRTSELQSNLQNMGILTPPSLITLDNARTLQIHLAPNDKAGEMLHSIINTETDTLGDVQKLCRYVYCMNDKERNEFLSKLEYGTVKTVGQGIKTAEKMRMEKDKGR